MRAIQRRRTALTSSRRTSQTPPRGVPSSRRGRLPSSWEASCPPHCLMGQRWTGSRRKPGWQQRRAISSAYPLFPANSRSGRVTLRSIMAALTSLLSRQKSMGTVSSSPSRATLIYGLMTSPRQRTDCTTSRPSRRPANHHRATTVQGNMTYRHRTARRVVAGPLVP